jgi:hypothetical protein
MMTRIKTLLIVLIFAGATCGAASAQDRIEDYVAALKVACAKEIKAQCKGIKEGKGRILACLYGREDKLSPRCGEVVLGSLDRLGEMLAALANVRRVCEADAKRLCNGVAAGEGNLIGCLAAARRSVSSQCNATLDSAFLRP